MKPGIPRQLCLIVTAAIVVWTTGCRGEQRGDVLDDLARRYVQLALALGTRDPDYVDAYYGPAEWRAQAAKERHSFESIERRGRELLNGVRHAGSPGGEPPLNQQRRRALERQVTALVFRARFLAGARAALDEETAALFDVVLPRREERDFEEAIARVGALLPGGGALASRYSAWLHSFTVPRERLVRVFDAALHVCRDRTRQHVRLPSSEALSVEFVANRAWNAFTLYRGDFRSQVQIDTSSPLTVDRVLDLACHEGYPGHHTIGTLADQALSRGRGWMEFTLEPLYSPHAFLMEGAANLGPELAFSDDERLRTERDVLFPLAGLDPARARELAPIRAAVQALGPAIVEGIRRYLDGQLDAPQFMFWLERYALMQDQEPMLKFVNRFRAYAVAYHEGAALVRAHINAEGRAPDRPERRWERFRWLVTSPVVPDDLSRASIERSRGRAATPLPRDR